MHKKRCRPHARVQRGHMRSAAAASHEILEGGQAEKNPIRGRRRRRFFSKTFRARLRTQSARRYYPETSRVFASSR